VSSANIQGKLPFKLQREAGSSEIATGLAFLMVAVLLAVRITVPREGPLYIWLITFFPLVMFKDLLRVCTKLREVLGNKNSETPMEVTYGMGAQACLFILCFIIVSVVAVAPLDPSHRWLLGGIGINCLALQSLVFRRRGAIALGIICACVGLLLSRSALPLVIGLMIFFGATGTIFAFAGINSLAKFIRRPESAPDKNSGIGLEGEGERPKVKRSL
jgi:hypothetical protein